jgi:hypothetical protein
MKQKEFNKLFYTYSKNQLEEDKAWDTYLKFYNICKNGDKDTIDYLEKIGSMNKKQMLEWRTRLAEMGMELTPDQVEDYIFVLSLAILKNWGSL